MIKGNSIKVFKLDGYNLKNEYDKINELLDTNLELEIDQSYGTDCFDLIKFDNKCPSKEELEKAIKNGEGYPTVIIDYLREIGELPLEDILFEVSY